MRALIDRADAHYRQGDRGLNALPWRSALAVAAARYIYRDIGRLIAARRYDPTAGRAWTSKPRKLVLVGRALLTIAASAPRRGWLALTGRGGITAPAIELRFEHLETP